MGAISKLEPSLKNIENLPCSTLIHPWTPSCWICAADVLLNSFVGSNKFYIVIYALQLIMKGRKINKEYILHIIKCYVSSLMCTSGMATISTVCFCFLRKLFAKYHYITLAYVPGFLGGLSILFENPTRRSINITMVSIQVCEFFLRRLTNLGLLKLSHRMETILFMLVSGTLQYCLRVIKGSYTTLWLFVPKHPNDQQDHCTHAGDCTQDILKAGATYFSYGVLIQLLRTILKSFKLLVSTPRILPRLVFQRKIYLLGVFAGLYVSLYKAVSCFLCKTRGKNDSWHVFSAGFIAGIAYWFQPNMLLILSGFSNVSQILGREVKKKFNISHWPIGELAFAICVGFVFHYRSCHVDCLPPYTKFVMDTVTNGRTTTIFDNINSYIYAT